MRETPQKRAIRSVLEQADRPLSPDEVLQSGQVLVDSLGIATVYRNLKSLVEAGWLRPVDLPGEPTRFEVSGKPHHHHFLCRSCDRAFEVDGCGWDIDISAPEGFLVEGHEVVLYGVCACCV